MLENSTYEKLKWIVNKFNYHLQDNTKPLFSEIVTTGETMELLEMGYVTEEKGIRTWNGKDYECWYYTPTIKGWRKIKPTSLIPMELGGGHYQFQVVFTGYAKDLCKKYLYDENWYGEEGSINTLYYSFWQLLKSKPFFSCKNYSVFYKLNKELLDIDTNEFGIPSKRFLALVNKVNDRCEPPKEGSKL